MNRFENVHVTKKANVYFDGLCVSHTIEFADGTRKSVGVILPSAPGSGLTFATAAPETMEVVSGRARVRLAGADEWTEHGQGESWDVPGDSSFDIEVLETLDYVCHFG